MKTYLKTVLTAAVALCVLAAGVCGCRRNSHKYRIGVSQPSRDEWRDMMNDEIMREMLFHDDAEVEIRTADDNDSVQAADIRYFIDNGFDAIIAAPNKAETLTPVISEAYGKGIPVIIFDRTVKGNDYTAYIDLDNTGVGRAAAAYARHALGGEPARVLEIRGLEGSTPADERHAGFTAAIDSGRLHTVVASESGGWKEQKARQVTDSLLRIYPDVRLIYAHNDLMAIGASKAARSLGLDDIIIIGTDAAPYPGLRAVSDSMITASVIYPTEGQRAVRTALAIVKGEPYSRVVHVPATSTVDRSNSDILLRQNELLKERTQQIETLNDRNRLILTRSTTQTYFLYAVVAVVLLLVAVMILMIRSIRQRKRYEVLLTDKNLELSMEKQNQEKLYEQLEDATRSKLTFFTNVSHDLRTPLSLIAEPIEQVAGAACLSPSQKALMSIALKNVSILKRMIDQILDLRRIQNGKTSLDIDSYNVAALIAEWTASFRSLADKRHICLVSNIDDDGTIVETDIEKVERIFFNLISNAFKYTRNGGRIEVSARSEKGCFILSIRDNGIGIPSDKLDRIFERFYQAEQSRTEGSGIGLSLAKAFTELLGGTISVESEPGKGSCFTVSIPLSLPGSGKAPATSAAPAGHVGAVDRSLIADMAKEAEQAADIIPETDSTAFDESLPILLVIEDNADMRRLIRELTAGLYNVIEAGDGDSGLRLAMKYIPDLIVCDIMMPVMDGLECCRLLKKERTTSHIPVLMLTSCRLDEQRVQSYESGADAFITKPFSADMLISRCRNLIDNRQRIRDLYLDGNTPPVQSPAQKLQAPARPDTPESGFYGDFIAIVAEMFADSGLSVAAIAARLNVGATQMTRKIKALTGMTPVDIIREYRLREARRLLLATDRSVSEIAYDVGFSSPQYFSRCFRESYGTTPSEFRESPR